jgi:hypothetical protein
MEYVEYIYDWLLGLAFGLTPFSSHQLKSIFIDAGSSTRMGSASRLRLQL